MQELIYNDFTILLCRCIGIDNLAFSTHNDSYHCALLSTRDAKIVWNKVKTNFLYDKKSMFNNHNNMFHYKQSSQNNLYVILCNN